MTTTRELLDNIFWHALTGPQARYATGSGGARRYAPGFSPIVAFEDPRVPDFDALRAHCQSGEHFYCSDWSGDVPAGWQLEAQATMYRMVWDAPMPAGGDSPAAQPLTNAHAQRAFDLAMLTKPGPFGPRTIELGEYIGCFEGERLVAMAGERAQASGYREVSGVCTHPDFQGRGHARKLMLQLIRSELQRGETPILHVMSTNRTAHELYRRMGFRVHSEPVVRVIAPM